MKSSGNRGLRLLIDALAARVGGGRRVGHELARALARRDDVDRVWLVVPEGTYDPVAAIPGVEPVEVDLGNRFPLVRRARWESFELPRLLRQVGADAVVALAGMLPRALDQSTVAMPANTLVFESSSPANLLRRLAVVRTGRRADAVLVASSHMASLLSRFLDVEIVPHGLDHDMFHAADAPGDELVFVADFYPHKRHDLVLATWERLSSPRPFLRLIGNPSTDHDLAATIIASGTAIDPDRFAVETLEEDEVPAALRRARVALMTSVQESFSLPMIESAACGVPMVARDLAVLRESGGPGATYIRGDDPEVWAAAVHELFSDDEAHARARQASLTHARGFSWEAKAEAVISALRHD